MDYEPRFPHLYLRLKHFYKDAVEDSCTKEKMNKFRSFILFLEDMRKSSYTNNKTFFGSFYIDIERILSEVTININRSEEQELAYNHMLALKSGFESMAKCISSEKAP